jgi:hypothetical protein
MLCWFLKNLLDFTSAPSSRMAPPNAAQGTLVTPIETRGNHASDNNNRAPGLQPSNVGSSGDSHSSKGSNHVASRNQQQMNQASAAGNSHVLQSTLQSNSSEGASGAANHLHVHKIQRPIQQQQQPHPQQRQQPQHTAYPSLANLHVATQHPNAPAGGGGGVLGHYVPGVPYAAMNLWQPGHPGHTQAVPSLRASAPEIDVGRGGASSGTAASGASGRSIPDWSAAPPAQTERRGRASFSGQAATVCISGPVGGGLSSREPERRSMDRTPRRTQPAATERAVQPLQRQQNPIVTEGHFRAAAAAAAATSQLWGMEGFAAGATPLHPSFPVSMKGAMAPGRQSFSEGGSASTRALPVASVTEEVAELPQQRATDPTEKASELDLAQAGHVSVVRPSAPGYRTNDSHGAISTAGSVVNTTALPEIGQLRREVEELRSQVLVLRASLECRDQDVARLNRQLQEVEINAGRGNISIHGPGTDLSTIEMRAVLSTGHVLQDGKEWDRRTSVDSQDSVLFSSLRQEPHSSVTPSSSIHLPRPPPILLETVSGLTFNPVEAQNGRGSRTSITVDQVPGKNEVLHLRERLSAIEEALQLMRDEARARTPIVESADISFVRLLGRGSFAEV